MNLPIIDNGVRPNNGPGSDAYCMYCKTPVGAEPAHKDDCIIPKRSVVVEMTIRYVVNVPRCFTEHDILFQRNDSSFCLGNDIEQLARENDAIPGSCNVCHRASVKFIREADEDDHEHLGWLGQRQ